MCLLTGDGDGNGDWDNAECADADGNNVNNRYPTLEQIAY